ncbi:MAG: transcription termination/antitermination NusG family protein, partial [Terracoccus sp.]
MSEQLASNDAQSTENYDSVENAVAASTDDAASADTAAPDVLMQTDPASDSPYSVHTVEMPETDDSDVVAVGDEIDAIDARTDREGDADDDAAADDVVDDVADGDEPSAASEPTGSGDPVADYKAELRSRLGDWFVIHSYAGYENRVKANLETRIQTLNMEDFIYEIEVPMEEVTEIKNGQKKNVRRVR